MHYKIVEKFGPEDGEKWRGYLEWRGLDLTAFDSADGILRPDLFKPETEEDWKNCVNEDSKITLITSLDYAKKILERYENSVLIGVDVKLEKGYLPSDGLLGFDVIDGYGDVSLVTNWGTDEENIINPNVKPNGLIAEFNRALGIRDSLRERFSEDAHAENCAVWAIYRVDI